MKKLGAKILLMVSSISIFTMIILITSNILIFNSIFSQIKEDAKNIASNSISSIDAIQLEKVIAANSMEIPEYKQLQQSMMEFKNDQNIKFFYTLVKGIDDTAYVAVDSALVEPSPLGEEYELENEMIEAFNGNVSVTKNSTSDAYGTFISAYVPIKNSAGEVIAIAGLDKDVESFISIKNSLLKTTIIVCVFLIILSFILSLLFSARISKSVKLLTYGLNKMSEGDLTNPIIITSRDEIQTIAEFVDNVRKSTVKTLGALKKSSETVAEKIGSLSLLSQELAESSEEVSTTINELADGNNIQSEEISKTNVIINNLGIKINEIVLSNENVNSKIQVINSNANISKNDLLLLEKAITEINLSFKDVKGEINELSAYLLKINEITKLIDHISQQTNILALNASIEAARAGEVGKSFAVVADEVKNLAIQTKDSALDISSLLENVMNKSNNVLKTSDNMDNKLSLQIEVIKNSIDSFKEIIDEIDKVIPTVVDVSNNMKEIDAEQGNVIKSIEATAAISEQVSASSEQISDTAQQLSLSSQKVAISAQNLNELSTDMINSINYFKI